MLEKHLWKSTCLLLYMLTEKLPKTTDKHNTSHPQVFRQKMFSTILQNSQKERLCQGLSFGIKLLDGKPKTVRCSHWKCGVKVVVLKVFANLTGKHLCWSLFLIKLWFWRPSTLLRKALTLILSCEIREIVRNNYFEENLWIIASKLYLKRIYNKSVLLWIFEIIQEHLFCRISCKLLVLKHQGFFFNKAACRTTWCPLTMLEIGSDSETFRKALLQNTSCQPLLIWRFLVFLFTDYWGLQRRNIQSRSILCSYGNQMDNSLSSCAQICADLKGKMWKVCVQTFTNNRIC